MHLIDTAVKSIRLIVTELRPSVIDDLGLNAAFEWQIDEFKERTGIPAAVQKAGSAIRMWIRVPPSGCSAFCRSH